MRMNPRAVAMMTQARSPAQTKRLDAHWIPAAGEWDSHAEDDNNDSDPRPMDESTHGVCNELTRIALNRSAVMEVYDSMFPRSGEARSTSRRRSRPAEAPQISWVRRMVGALRGQRHA